jgi:hypothetical protein
MPWIDLDFLFSDTWRCRAANRAAFVDDILDLAVDTPGKHTGLLASGRLF